MHSKLDLNLLVALDALLEEGSVNGAAARLHLSGPAMSRALGRVRKAICDPVLVRSGRTMVRTPHAEAIRAEVHALVARATRLFDRTGPLDLSTLERTFTIQADDSTFAVVGAALLTRIRRDAPGVTIRFLGEGPRDNNPPLRDGTADLEIGVIDRRTPETRVERLVSEESVVVVRRGHPLATGTPVSLRDYAAAEHLTVSRRGILRGPIDDFLAGHGLAREVVVSVPTASIAMLMVADSDLVGRAARRMHRPLVDRLGLVVLETPLVLPSLDISQGWHAKFDADEGHAWLRERVREVFGALTADGPGPRGTGAVRTNEGQSRL
ncbi:LysR family transcriptional regulator [Phytomonospora sp. NPDC050363]|uniref:LysR family transcriptional regulator n=1 Tax=Phytomonospora sp. NPDC050363 TaxID=3155642 RepID=UPI0033C999BF